MYICIDVGGTKTLVANVEDNGVIAEQTKIPTPKEYSEFLSKVAEAIADFPQHEYVAGGVGIPASVFDREKGIAHSFGNLPWEDATVAKDLEPITHCRMFAENDAKLGALSEAMLVKNQFSKVLFVTVSTGIGYAVVDHLNIDITAGDGGGRILLAEKDGKYIPWEWLASGQALVKRYGMMAKDITDPSIWQEFSYDLANGLIKLVAIFQPEVIIIGGSVGHYYDRYADFLRKGLESYQLPQAAMPKIKAAERIDDAVIYGCYDYAKQKIQNG